MSKRELHCQDCRGKTTHQELGFMPVFFTQEESSDEWENVAMCTECGGLSPLPVESEQVNRAHERYLQSLVKYGVMTREEVEEAVNG